MELRLNDYVRTEYGIARYIGDLVTSETNYRTIDKNIVYTNIEGWENVVTDNEIIKSSPNIIDLIELNDVVELFEEDGLDDDKITGYYEVIAITTNKKEIGVRTANGEIDFFPVENLRGIITYEQIKTMEYKCE